LMVSICDCAPAIVAVGLSRAITTLR
jgi:hypothetical protein